MSPIARDLAKLAAFLVVTAAMSLAYALYLSRDRAAAAPPAAEALP